MSRLHPLPLVALAASALLLAGCSDATTAAGEVAASGAPSTSVTVTHAQGETEVPVDPERVLTFDYASLLTLDALDVQVAGIPRASLPGSLSAFDTDDYLDIGTVFEPDYEAVAAAEPDLIIVAGRSAEVYPQLAEIAPTIDLSTDAADVLGSATTNTATLGEIFGEEEAAEELVGDLNDSIAEVQEVTADAGTGLVVLTNAGEISAYGPGSRFGFLHDELGVEPAVPDIEAATHGEAISFEYLLEHDPDWLFVVDRDSATGSGSGNAQQVLDNDIVRQTSAFQEDRIVYLDPTTWYIIGGGVTNLSEMTAEVGEALAG